MEEESEEEERKGRYWKLCPLGLVILVIGLFIAILLLLTITPAPKMLFVYLYPPLDPDAGGWKNFALKIVTRSMNFSDADAYCNSQGENGQMPFPATTQEDRYILKLVEEVHKNATSSVMLGECNSRFYIGVRKSFINEWTVPSGEFVAAIDLLPDIQSRNFDWSHRHCTKLVVQDYFKIGTMPCVHEEFACVVCQFTCDDGVSWCYIAYNDKSIKSYDDAETYCDKRKPGSLLAGVTSTVTLNVIWKQVHGKLGSCDRSLAVGNIFAPKFESIREEPLKFVPSKIRSLQKSGPSDNCVVINDEIEPLWEFTDCAKPNCFICKVKKKDKENNRIVME